MFWRAQGRPVRFNSVTRRMISSRADNEIVRGLTVARYSLRNLLVVITAVAIVFARVGYLKTLARLHRNKADALIAQIGDFRQNPRDYVATLIDDDASSGKAYKFRRSPGSIGSMKMTVSVRKGMPFKVVWLDETCLDAWEAAVIHKILAERYERAVYRPWTLVSEAIEP
jgi:hypothetical protein